MPDHDETRSKEDNSGRASSPEINERVRKLNEQVENLSGTFERIERDLDEAAGE